MNKIEIFFLKKNFEKQIFILSLQPDLKLSN